MAIWAVRTKKTAERMWKLDFSPAILSSRSGVVANNAISPPKTFFSSIRSATADRRLLGGGDNKVGGVFPAFLRCFSSLGAHLTTLQHHHEEEEESAPAPVTEPERSTYPVLLVPRPKNQMETEDDDEYYHYFHLADFEETEEEEEEERKPLKVRRIKENKIPGEPNYECVGSSHGWLAFMDPNNFSINFVNPLIHSDHIRKSFWLPSIPSGGFLNNLEVGDIPFEKKVGLSSPPKRDSYYHGTRRHLAFYKHQDGTWWTPGGSDFGDYRDLPLIHKVALSSPPDEDSYMAAAIHGPRRRLAFYKHKDRTWWTPGGVGDYSDVIYSNKDGFFYTLRNPQTNDKLTDYTIQAWDPFSHQSALIHPYFCDPEPHTFENDYWVGELDEKRYLVESSPSRDGGGGGDLYLVLRYICKFVSEDHLHSPVYPEDYDPYEFITYKTFFFRAYKLIRGVDMYCWEAVNDLDGQCFYVGMNHSFSVPDAHLHHHVLRENCVYYSDDCFDKMHLFSHSGGHDNGVYEIDDIQSSVIYNRDLSKYQPPPIWLDVLSQP